MPCVACEHMNLLKCMCLKLSGLCSVSFREQALIWLNVGKLLIFLVSVYILCTPAFLSVVISSWNSTPIPDIQNTATVLPITFAFMVVLKVVGSWLIFGFVSKHQCFESDIGS